LSTINCAIYNFLPLFPPVLKQLPAAIKSTPASFSPFGG
jgi:hypothetical protein